MTHNTGGPWSAEGEASTVYSSGGLGGFLRGRESKMGCGTQAGSGQREHSRKAMGTNDHGN